MEESLVARNNTAFATSFGSQILFNKCRRFTLSQFKLESTAESIHFCMRGVLVYVGQRQFARILSLP